MDDKDLMGRRKLQLNFPVIAFMGEGMLKIYRDQNNALQYISAQHMKLWVTLVNTQSKQIKN